MVDTKIIEAIRKYILEAGRSGVQISEAFLFGSYAKDQADEESDLDVLLVCPEYNESTSEQINDLLWSLRARTDSRIEPVPVAEREWSEGAGGIIADIARREGIRISIARY